MHGEAVKAHKTVRGNEATGSHQVLPRGLARKCPVDIFAEAAIPKEYLSAEDRPAPASGRASECCGTKTLSSHELTNLARM
ncbi:hypothetical protein [Desulfosporosinus youngiae]|uniref:hypothetical protein n=1 Tax=Desulfosporosinus youngiae TaxID=339862 RepID=UPI000A04832D|nr:hypothetical protein [Desulfosporosinus youngiae]